MHGLYTIYTQQNWTEVYLCVAPDEESALKMFMRLQLEYIDLEDGAYREVGRPADSLGDALATFGIVEQVDGTYIDKYDRVYKDIDEVLVEYCIETQPQGSFVSHNSSYRSLDEALYCKGIVKADDGTYSDVRNRRPFSSLDAALAAYSIESVPNPRYVTYGKTFGDLEAVKAHLGAQCRLEVRPASLNPLFNFQQVLCTYDEWQYVSKTSYAEVVRNHHWQARRYEALGEYGLASHELDGALPYESRADRVKNLAESAYILRRAGKIDEAVGKYRLALASSNPTDNQPSIMYHLAEALLLTNNLDEARDYYARAVAEDPDLENNEVFGKYAPNE